MTYHLQAIIPFLANLLHSKLEPFSKQVFVCCAEEVVVGVVAAVVV
jgi:hypothetical protein